jgi:hypothetical protein
MPCLQKMYSNATMYCLAIEIENIEKKGVQRSMFLSRTTWAAFFYVETTKTRKPEPEFLKILKCDLAESAITGFQFNCWYF